METKFNITGFAGNELIVREGEAPPVKPKKSISIKGILSAPVEFLAGKTIDAERTHLRIYGQEGKLELFVNDTAPEESHEIIGSLTKDKSLESFGINTSKRWGIQEFLRFVKMNRYFFSSQADHANLLKGLQNWSAGIERIINEKNDNQGNSNFQLETKVKKVEGFIDRFNIDIPVYQGYPKQVFTVEIGLDPKATSVDLYLFSDDLFELEIKLREGAIDEQLVQMGKYSFSKIRIS